MADQPTEVSVSKETSRTPHSVITEAQVKVALTADKGSNAQLVSWDIEDFTRKGDNYMCVVTSIRVQYRQEGTEKRVTYVAKCATLSQAESVKDMVSCSFEKESGFYKYLVPLLNAELNNLGQEQLHIPTYFSSHEIKGEELIVMEDLRPDGFKMFDRMKGMDKAHAILVLKELGRLHAASILIQSKIQPALGEKYKVIEKDFTYYNKTLEEWGQEMLASMVTNGAAMLDNIGDYDKVVVWLNEFARDVINVFREQLKKVPPFEVLCHGDCWNNNILFKYNEEGAPVDVKLLDFQFCSVASPATDLNYFMFNSFNGSDRKENLQAYLNTYYDSFRKVLEEAGTPVPFSVEELHQEFHKKNIYGLLMSLLIIPIVLNEGTHKFDFNETSNMEKFREDYKETSLNELKNNPIFRPRFIAIIDEMINYGVIS
ncbi:uncharacterized protein LOC121871847 isoform X2 [Homarus americanus]|uniref:uncharacterized protein LOC121871847 isoform X1 n=1 Tax=Homarus americanus TaxID=6706 RepID=UPI001C479541|nr:uncharacterized protein LOC121871847 isoform X1 [Homarus americanus]XP_042230325.1 uncharacterized protein LOC121871847 isoform X2 [Homarus americanus]